jgi:hypothetical protein
MPDRTPPDGRRDAARIIGRRQAPRSRRDRAGLPCVASPRHPSRAATAAPMPQPAEPAACVRGIDTVS